MHQDLDALGEKLQGAVVTPEQPPETPPVDPAEVHAARRGRGEVPWRGPPAGIRYSVWHAMKWCTILVYLPFVASRSAPCDKHTSGAPHGMPSTDLQPTQIGKATGPVS